MSEKGSKSETLITLGQKQLPVVSIFSIHASPRSWNLCAPTSARQQRPQKAVPRLADRQPIQLEKQLVAGPFTLRKESMHVAVPYPRREFIILHLPLSYPNRLYQLRFQRHTV